MTYHLDWQEHINVHVLAAIVELGEMIQNTNWRPWKSKKTINYKELKEEYIDVIHFIINIGLLLDITPKELCDLYVKKNKVNHYRQKIKY